MLFIFTEIDDDLSRLIHQVYRKNKQHYGQPPELHNETTVFGREKVANDTDKSKIEFEGKFVQLETQMYKNKVEVRRKSSYERSDYRISNTISRTEEIKDNNETCNKADFGKEVTILHKIPDTTETLESNSKKTNAESRRFKQSNSSHNYNQRKRNENDENVDKMTAAIMESYIRKKQDKPHDMMAFCWLWDFAGQRDFYATHQVFLSTCAVYLLVTDSLEFTAEKLWTNFEDSARKFLIFKTQISLLSCVFVDNLYRFKTVHCSSF